MDSSESASNDYSVCQHVHGEVTHARARPTRAFPLQHSIAILVCGWSPCSRLSIHGTTHISGHDGAQARCASTIDQPSQPRPPCVYSRPERTCSLEQRTSRRRQGGTRADLPVYVWVVHVERCAVAHRSGSSQAGPALAACQRGRRCGSPVVDDDGRQRGLVPTTTLCRQLGGRGWLPVPAVTSNWRVSFTGSPHVTILRRRLWDALASHVCSVAPRSTATETACTLTLPADCLGAARSPAAVAVAVVAHA